MSTREPATAPFPPVDQPTALAVDPHERRRHRLGFGVLLPYGAGGIVDAATAVFLGTFLYFYLTAVCGLSGTLAGTGLGLALIVDAIVDPLVGSLSDNSRLRLGRRHPFMLAAALPIMMALGLLFSVPPALKGPQLLAYVLALTVALRFGLSVFIVPYIALGAELSDDHDERSKIVAFRLGVGTIGTVAILVLGYGVFLSARAGGQLHRAGYAPFAWCGAAVVFAAAMVSALGTLKARDRLHPAIGAAGVAALRRFWRDMGEVFRNRSFVILFADCMIFVVANGVAGALTLHANTFFWRFPPAIILVVSLSAIPGLYAGLAVTGLMTPRFERRTISLCGMTLICVCQFAPVTLRLAGVVPPAGPAPVATLILAAALSSIGATMAIVAFQSMMADIADEHELIFGSRREGLCFAGISFAGKASSGLGVAIAGLAADAIHFPNNLAAHGANVAIPWPIVRNLGLIYGPGAAVVTASGILLLLTYRLNRASHAQVLATLAERRAH